ncbi:hypothetical protein [Herpetosiphon geysericola]|uniref:hypothetical protein n=1 Tax=Herpetosiphon geysericola TaxID=70996 RepID=UPI0006C8FDA6|nr:hypothetical protein [Herpetosiphon geysericola]
MSNDQYSNQPPVDPNQQPYQPYNQAPPNQQQQQPYQPYNQPPPDQQQPYQPYQPYSQGPQTQPQGQFVVPSSDQLVSGFKGLSQGRRLAIGGGLVAWISYFLPWYHVRSTLVNVNETVNGITGFLPSLGFLLLSAILASLIAPLFGKHIYPLIQRTLNLTFGKAVFLANAAVLAMALIGGLIAKPDNSGFAEIDAGFSFGFYLAILALGAATAGGWMMQQNRE